MDIPKIELLQEHFKMTVNHSELFVPKNETSLAIMEMIKPPLEKAQAKHSQLQTQMLPQFHNILQLIEILKENQTQFPEGEFNEIMVRLEETYYFIYDLMKLMEIEIPTHLFVSH